MMNSGGRYHSSPRLEIGESVMRIEPTGTPPLTSKPVESAPRTAAPSAAPAGGAGEAESFALSADLAALLTAVKQAPEVRADVIESVAARLAVGEMDTPEAAADAARALLADPPAPPASE
jgi:hypothetical protein